MGNLSKGYFMLDVKQLRQLVELYEVGSVTGAAEKLHISQPALTAHLNRLESRLGNKLFIRSAKGLEATPMGQELYLRSKDMLRQWLAFDSEVSLLAGDELGSIRVVCGPVVEQGILPNASVHFLQQHPGVDLLVDVYNPDRMLESMRNGDADIAVGAFARVVGLDVERLDTRDLRIAFYVRTGHPLLGMKDWLTKLKEFPLAAPQIPPESMRWIEQKGLLGAKRNVATNSYTLLKTIAKNTDHVIGGPRFLFAHEVGDGELVELPIKGTPPWSISVLVTRPASHSKIVNDFVSCIRTEMAAIGR